jgi:methyl-accepting chemotaxis protein
MKNLNSISIKYKIVISFFVIFSLSTFVLVSMSATKMQTLTTNNYKERLEIVSDGFFLSLRTAMNLGDTKYVQDIKEKIKQTKGVKEIEIAKSKKVIELFDSKETFTNDKAILKTFETKKTQLIEHKTKDDSLLRMIKPMVATNECISCHANSKIGDVLGVMDLTFSLKSSIKIIDQSVREIMIYALIFSVFSLLLAYLITSRATKPIKYLQDGMESFFKFLSQQTSDIEPIKIVYMDEIGKMSHEINNNIALIEKQLKKQRVDAQTDNKFLEDVKNRTKELNSGIIKIQEFNTPANDSLKELKTHTMQSYEFIQKTIGRDLNKITKLMDNYSNYDYTKSIDNPKGYVEVSLNNLGVTINEMLYENKNIIQELNNNSNKLATNTSLLNSSTKKQAENLHETIVAINSINESMTNSKSNITIMSSLASMTKEASKNGKKLTNKSAKTMKEIVNSTNEIKKAIDIINQIAFQTNILSLNAAVEAATAGEAGKGFAVVANEVRNLASKSSEAAQTIKELVDTAEAKVTEGTEISNTLIDGFDTLDQSINQTTELIQTTVKSTLNQTKALEKINNNIETLEESMKSIVDVAKTTDNITKDTSSLADTISKKIKKYKLAK